MEYLAILFTHSGAIKYERFLKAKDISVKLMPIPRKLSSSCAIGAKFEYDKGIEEIILEDIQSIYRINNKQYELIYDIE